MIYVDLPYQQGTHGYGVYGRGVGEVFVDTKFVDVVMVYERGICDHCHDVVHVGTGSGSPESTRAHGLVPKDRRSTHEYVICV